MIKKVIISIYISLIVPLVTIYLLPTLYINIIANNKVYYYTNKYNWAFIIFTVIIILSTYITSNKKLYKIIYYIIGIAIGLISMKEKSLYLQTFIHQYILIIGYAILILISFLLLIFTKNDNNVLTNHKIFKN